MGSHKDIESLCAGAIDLLKTLIATPSMSRHEDETARLLVQFFREKNITAERIENNVWVKNSNYDAALPTLLLNSHHDTVPPNKGYTIDPFKALVKEGKILGLGANDAGGPLVSLLFTFLHFYNQLLPFNLIFAASAEEEISGRNGIELLLKSLPPVQMAIVGEPTQMKMAVAEKGLMVLDCTTYGKSGHAARDEGENALYKAVADIDAIRDLIFEKTSPMLGPVHLAVTSIETKNKAHNVVPAECTFVVDVRVNEQYTFEEVINELKKVAGCNIIPRSMRLRPSFISGEHPLVKAGLRCRLQTYGSPTLSDMALMSFPAVKLGPGDSARSHTTDEFIFADEVKNGITKYIELIDTLKETIKTNF